LFYGHNVKWNGDAIKTPLHFVCEHANIPLTRDTLLYGRKCLAFAESNVWTIDMILFCQNSNGSKVKRSVIFRIH